MTKQPFMQMYWADYFGDTRRLSCEQHGAYLQLLGSMWLEGGSLPNDDKLLAKITSCTPARWAKIKAVVLKFFTVNEDTITQRRLREELERAQEKSIIRAVVGSRGGKANALKRQEVGVAIATGLPQHLPELDIEPPVVPQGTGELFGPPAPPAEPPPVDVIRAAVDLWNEVAARNDLPTCRTMSEARRKSIRCRVADAGGLDGWRTAMAAVEASAFLLGQLPGARWRATLDFVLQPSSFAKLLDGNYGKDAKPAAGAIIPIDEDAVWAQRVATFRAEGFWRDGWGDPPSHPNCHAPCAILAASGYAGGSNRPETHPEVASEQVLQG